jgi:hypothetical protein
MSYCPMCGVPIPAQPKDVEDPTALSCLQCGWRADIGVLDTGERSALPAVALPMPDPTLDTCATCSRRIGLRSDMVFHDGRWICIYCFREAKTKH